MRLVLRVFGRRPGTRSLRRRTSVLSKSGGGSCTLGLLGLEARQGGRARDARGGITGLDASTRDDAGFHDGCLGRGRRSSAGTNGRCGRRGCKTVHAMFTGHSQRVLRRSSLRTVHAGAGRRVIGLLREGRVLRQGGCRRRGLVLLGSVDRFCEEIFLVAVGAIRLRERLGSGSPSFGKCRALSFDGTGQARRRDSIVRAISLGRRSSRCRGLAGLQILLVGVGQKGGRAGCARWEWERRLRGRGRGRR